MALTPVNPEDIRESVRSHYSKSALAVMAGVAACCGPAGIDDATGESGAGFYETAAARGSARDGRAGVAGLRQPDGSR